MTMFKLMRVRIDTFFDSYVYTVCLPEDITDSEFADLLKKAHGTNYVAMERVV